MKYIFVHGLGQNSSTWEKTISFLDNKTITNIAAPDLFLLHPKNNTYSNLYTSFCNYLDEFSEPLVLVGLSLGAILSLHYTIEHPQRVQSLVLIGAQYKIPKWLMKIQSNIFRLMPNSTFQKIGSSKSVFIQLTKSMMDLDFSNELKNIQINTLVLCGEKDIANKRAAKKLAELIPNSKLITVNQAGHEINTEAPEELALILNKHFKNN